MIIAGTTSDGRQIQQGHGFTHVETITERDARIAEAAAEKVRDCAPEMLAMLKEIAAESDNGGGCPRCGQYSYSTPRHLSNCDLANLIAKATGEL